MTWPQDSRPQGAGRRRGPVVLVAGGCAALAAVLGYQWQRPVSDTDIIDRYAAEFVATTGGQATECQAVPGGTETIRMVITCAAGTERETIYHVGPRGARLTAPAEERPEA